MRRDHFVWTAEADAVLAELYAAGYSFSGIATAMSRQFAWRLTKMAAIGRADRLHFEPRLLPKATNPLGPAGGNGVRQARGRARMKKIIPAEEIPPPTQAVELPPDQSPHACTLAELEPASCRWPIGDHPWLFCGATRIAGFPYCRRHALMAHPQVKPTPNRPIRWREA